MHLATTALCTRDQKTERTGPCQRLQVVVSAAMERRRAIMRTGGSCRRRPATPLNERPTPRSSCGSDDAAYRSCISFLHTHEYSPYVDVGRHVVCIVNAHALSGACCHRKCLKKVTIAGKTPRKRMTAANHRMHTAMPRARPVLMLQKAG